MVERAVQQEIKRRTVKIWAFPSEASLPRIVSSVLTEIDDNWVSAGHAYLIWDPLE